MNIIQYEIFILYVPRGKNKCTLNLHKMFGFVPLDLVSFSDVQFIKKQFVFHNFSTIPGPVKVLGVHVLFF